MNDPSFEDFLGFPPRYIMDIVVESLTELSEVQGLSAVRTFDDEINVVITLNTTAIEARHKVAGVESMLIREYPHYKYNFSIEIPDERS